MTKQIWDDRLQTIVKPWLPPLRPAKALQAVRAFRMVASHP